NRAVDIELNWPGQFCIRDAHTPTQHVAKRPHQVFFVQSDHPSDQKQVTWEKVGLAGPPYARTINPRPRRGALNGDGGPCVRLCSQAFRLYRYRLPRVTDIPPTCAPRLPLHTRKIGIAGWDRISCLA